jgi:acyl-CoA thioesterase I
MRRRELLIGAAGLALAGCEKKPRDPRDPALPRTARVLALGDSLTAGIGADVLTAWPAVLASLTGWDIVNEGRSGDTTAGGLERLAPLLAASRFDAVIVGLGGNDMLRRVPERDTVANLEAMAALSKAHTGHTALIATPRPTLAAHVTRSLSDAEFYGTVADRSGVALIPGVYAEVLSRPELRSDDIHANAAGYAEVARAIHARLGKLGWV